MKPPRESSLVVALQRFIVLLAVLLTGCAGQNVHGDAVRISHAIVLIEPTGTADTYEYAVLNAEGLPPPGTSLNFYQDGIWLGRSRLEGLSESPVDNDAKLVFSPAMQLDAATLLTGRDINPGGKYRSRPATPDERAGLMTLAHVSSLDAGRVHSEDEFTIITDSSGRQGDVAVYTSRVVSGLDDPQADMQLRAYLGIFVKDGAGNWRHEYADTKSGCEGCESQPPSYSLVGFGEVHTPEHLTLLFRTWAYESSGFSQHEVCSSGQAGWLAP